MAQATATIIKNTQDVRDKLLATWKLIDEKKISASEARLHLGYARAILETLKVEIAAAHLTQTRLPPVAFGVGAKIEALPVRRGQEN